MTRFGWPLLAWLLCAFGGGAEAKVTYIAVDHATGEVVGLSGPDAPNYPASLTKMMTLYLTFDALRAGRLRLSSPLKVSPKAASMPASKLGLRAGSTITVADAIPALTVNSANDVAVVLAEALGGSEARFAQQMTRVARLKGLQSTTFRNASGLPDERQVTTARDMATLARRLITDFPEHYGYFGLKTFTWGRHVEGNHNRLLFSYPGMDGLKTGYIRASGYNLAASAVRDRRRIVAVVLGGSSNGHRNGIMQRVLDDGFSLAGRKGAVVAALPPVVPLVQPGPPARELLTTKRPRRAAVAEGDAAIGRYGVQVGAFTARDAARKAASRAAILAPKQAAGAVVATAKSANGKAYTARLVGLSSASAKSLCAALAKKKQSCLVVRGG